jgi:hypothetical protein
LPIAFVLQVAKVLLLRYGKKYILHFCHFELPCVFLGREPKSNVGCLILRYFPLSFYLLFIFSLIGFDGKFIVTHFDSTFLFPICSIELLVRDFTEVVTHLLKRCVNRSSN